MIHPKKPKMLIFLLAYFLLSSLPSPSFLGSDSHSSVNLSYTVGTSACGTSMHAGPIYSYSFFWFCFNISVKPFNGVQKKSICYKKMFLSKSMNHHIFVLTCTKKILNLKVFQHVILYNMYMCSFLIVGLSTMFWTKYIF